MKKFILLFIASLCFSSASFAKDLIKCSRGSTINKVATRMAKHYFRTDRRFPPAVRRKSGKIKGGYARTKEGKFVAVKQHMFFEGVFRLADVNVEIPHLEGLQGKFKRNNLVHVCWTMNGMDNYRLYIYFMKGYKLDSYGDSIWTEKIVRTLTYIPNKLFKTNRPYAKISAANLGISPVNGALGIIERLVYLGWIPDIIRDSISDITNLITHDVLSIFAGTGVERIRITPKGIKLSFGIDLLGHNESLTNHFIPFDKKEYDKPAKSSSGLLEMHKTTEEYFKNNPSEAKRQGYKPKGR